MLTWVYGRMRAVDMYEVIAKPESDGREKSMEEIRDRGS